jgi:hypothetical protein
MKNVFEDLFKKKWGVGLILLLPFTGIINAGWFVILFFIYFIAYIVWLYES